MLARQLAIASIPILFTVQAAHGHPVTITIEAPKVTPNDAKVYISGSHPKLGGWKPNVVEAKKQPDGRYVVNIELPEGTYGYKVTLGSWDTVEKSSIGVDISNRILTVIDKTEVEISVATWGVASAPKTKYSTATGEIRFHRDFKSKHLKFDRDIAVYLPPEYDKNRKEAYPVFYMHDGQNLFDSGTAAFGVEWGADETADELFYEKRIDPIVIVGIFNTHDRTSEYTPDRDDKRDAGGKGEAYAKFVVDEVIPFVESKYHVGRKREDRAIGGSSLGGLISLYICKQYPKTFSRCAVVSPALMWNERSLIKSLDEDHKSLRGLRIWLDMGTQEGKQIDQFSTAISDTRALVAAFKKTRMLPGRDYYYQEVYGGEHNEASWAARFDDILLYFYGKPDERKGD